MATIRAGMQLKAETLYICSSSTVIPSFMRATSRVSLAAWMARMRKSMAGLRRVFRQPRGARSIPEQHYLPGAESSVSGLARVQLGGANR